MTSSISRRQFIQTAVAFGLGTVVATADYVGFAAPKSTGWRVTSRDVHMKATGEADVWTAMKVAGVDGLEVTVNEQLACPGLHHPKLEYTLATSDGLARVKDDFEKSGKVITSFCMHNRLEERLEEEIAWTRRLVHAAQALKVDVIRIDVVPRNMAAAEFLPFAINACKQLCETAEGTSVRFGVENHGAITNDPSFTEKLFDGAGSAKLGLTMDCMNFYWFGHPLKDVYAIFEKFAPRTFHTHCKNLKYPEEKRNEKRPMGWEYAKYVAPLYDGDIDYKRVAAILRRAGYQGDLCLENECLHHFPREQYPAILKKEIAYLRSIASA